MLQVADIIPLSLFCSNSNSPRESGLNVAISRPSSFFVYWPIVMRNYSFRFHRILNNISWWKNAFGSPPHSGLKGQMQQSLESAGKESTHFASALLEVMARGQSKYYLLVIGIHCTGVSIHLYLRPLFPS